MSRLAVEDYEERYAVEPAQFQGYDAILVGFRIGRLFRVADWPLDKVAVGLYDPRQATNSQEKMSEPYFYLIMADGRMMPYSFSDADILARNWVRV